jgi:hypothetical protein
MRPDTVKPAKAVFESVETMSIVDGETGEIKTTERRKVVTKSDKAESLTFTKMFYRDLGRLYSLSRTAVLLFVDMSGMMSDTSNQVVMTEDVRQEIGKRIGVKNQAIYNATRELTRAGLLVRVINGVYMIDPHLFAVGTDPAVLANRERFNSLRKIVMEVQYDKDGRQVKVSVE